MPYKDKEVAKVAARLRQRKHRAKLRTRRMRAKQGVTKQGVTEQDVTPEIVQVKVHRRLEGRELQAYMAITPIEQLEAEGYQIPNWRREKR